MSEKLRGTEINISLASQLIPEPRLPFHSASFFVDNALEAGYQGAEWYPLRNTSLVGLQTNTGVLPQYVKDAIKSAHQSWRAEKTILESRSHPRPMIALGSFVLFPQTDQSLQGIVRIQRNIGRKLPVVTYPDTASASAEKKWPFASKTYQPNKAVMEKFGATDISDMIEKGREKGYDSLTVDIHHMLELGTWQDLLPQLLPHASEIHVAVGRIDDDTDPKTEQKLEDLYFGRVGTEIYQILEAIKNSRWKGRVVTEIPYQALMNLRKKNKDSISTKDFMEDHARIVDNLKAILI